MGDNLSAECAMHSQSQSLSYRDLKFSGHCLHVEMLCTIQSARLFLKKLLHSCKFRITKAIRFLPCLVKHHQPGMARARSRSRQAVQQGNAQRNLEVML